LDAGHEVLATDRVQANPTAVPLHVADLLHRGAVARLFDRTDALVHLANHIGFNPPDPQVVVSDNVSMNVNVFQAAADAGVTKIVFASSVQTLGSHEYPRKSPGDVTLPAYLPLDSASPARAANPYALSKQVGEAMLEYFARQYGLSCVALRFPCVGPEPPQQEAPSSPGFVTEGCGYLTYGDAADLTVAILRSHLPGFRIYLPAKTCLSLNTTIADMISEYYPGVPLRRPLDEMDSLIDISRITAETGWTPTDRVTAE